jgi:hypothetical protein
MVAAVSWVIENQNLLPPGVREAADKKESNRGGGGRRRKIQRTTAKFRRLVENRSREGRSLNGLGARFGLGIDHDA